jgi:tRNA (adenine57-N1/adenine58-N1)-methyltransferase
MSFAEPRRRTIESGDLVILHEVPATYVFLRVTPGQNYQSRNGMYRHDDMIKRPFGSRVPAYSRAGFSYAKPVFLLPPSPELWTLALHHRTQVLYDADIAWIVSALELRPGYKVFEAGTGSGSLTHALSRAVGPSGRVFTFDFHADRAAAAEQEFIANGLSNVTVNHGDVTSDTGFHVTVSDASSQGKINELGGVIGDAVFLDVPEPWLAMDSVCRVLRAGGVFVGFSPCMEQVQKAGEAMRRCGFVDIRMVECVSRGYESRKMRLVPPQLKRKAKKARVEQEEEEERKNEPKEEDEEKEEKEEEENEGQLAEQEDGEEGENGANGMDVWLARPDHYTRGHTGYLYAGRRFVPLQG